MQKIIFIYFLNAYFGQAEPLSESGELNGVSVKKIQICFFLFFTSRRRPLFGRGRRIHIYGGLVPHTPGVFKKQKEKGYKERFTPFWVLLYIYIILLRRCQKLAQTPFFQTRARG